jgi:hypothetical protein
MQLSIWRFLGWREPSGDILLARRLMTSPRPSDFYTDFWTLAYEAIDD